MPAILDRKTGEVISAPEFTREQKQAMVAAIVKGYIRKHPEIITERMGKE